MEIAPFDTLPFLFISFLPSIFILSYSSTSIIINHIKCFKIELATTSMILNLRKDAR